MIFGNDLMKIHLSLIKRNHPTKTNEHELNTLFTIAVEVLNKHFWTIL